MNGRRQDESNAMKPVNSAIVLYQTADGQVTVDVFFARDNFWLTQRTMAELFGVKTPAVSRHLKNIYASGELTREATISKMETVQTEGGRQIAREVEFYNLDAAIAKAHEEYAKFRVKQDQGYLSDFDQAFAKYLKGDNEP
ncbi:MAG: hypothetical protein V2A65_11675 [Candidatus Omnitrophota bacterium]